MIYLCTYNSNVMIRHWFYHEKSVYSVAVFRIKKTFIYSKDNSLCKRFVYKKYVPNRVWHILDVDSKPDLENIILNKIIYGLES